MRRTTPPRPFDVASVFPELAPWHAGRPGCIHAPGRPRRTTARSAGRSSGPPTSPGRTAKDRIQGTGRTRPSRPTTSGCTGASGPRWRTGPPVPRPRSWPPRSGSRRAARGPRARSPCCPWPSCTSVTSPCCARRGSPVPICSRSSGAPSTTRNTLRPQCSGAPPRPSPTSWPRRPSRRMIQFSTYLPEPCRLAPERVTEYPHYLELSEELREQLGDWSSWQAAGQVLDTSYEVAPEELYMDMLSISPGWKAAWLDPLGSHRSHTPHLFRLRCRGGPAADDRHHRMGRRRGLGTRGGPGGSCPGPPRQPAA